MRQFPFWRVVLSKLLTGELVSDVVVTCTSKDFAIGLNPVQVVIVGNERTCTKVEVTVRAWSASTPFGLWHMK
jgi:hypothetical protein